MVDREQIHKAIDELSPRKLETVGKIVEALRLQKDEPDPDWFGKLYDLFAPVRDGVEASGMTDDEVNQILDEALAEVRRERQV